MRRAVLLAALATVTVLPPLRPSSPSITGDSTVLVRGTTVPVKLSDALANVLNVKSFGAKCDGSTNDTTAIVLALAALPAAGGTLNFPAATCKFNLSTTRGGIVIAGQGSGNVNTGLGGTVFTAAIASSPILQFGDGATTTSRGNMVRDVIMVGDGLNATGDGIYLFGARDFTADNVAITSMGRDAVRIQCNTMSSSGIHLSRAALSGSRGANIRAESCALPGFTTDITVNDSHISGYSAVGSYSIYLDSVILWLSNTYVDVGDNNAGNVTMKNTLGNPRIVASNVSFDNTGPSTGVTLDVSTWITAANRIGTAITGTYTINGTVNFSDTSFVPNSSTNGSSYQPRHLNPSVLTKLYFPFDETDITANVVGFSRLNATGSNTEAVSLTSAALRLVGTVTFPLQFNGTSIWRDATSGVLRSRLANNPSGDHQGLQLWPKLNKPALVSGGTATIDGAQGTIFYLTPVDNVNFTVANPTNFGSSTATVEHITVCVLNTTGGALGTATFNAQYHLAGAWTQPAGTGGSCTAAGCRRCAEFRGDDSGTQVWHEMWRSAADVAN